jgi:hypothetical protein
MILLRGSAKAHFRSPYTLKECAARIHGLRKGIPGISSISSSAWLMDDEFGGFLVERRVMLRRIARVEGTLNKENDKSTFIQFEFSLNPQFLFLFYLCLIVGTWIFVGNYIDKRYSLLGVILGMGCILLVGAVWISYPIRLARLVRRVLS